MEEWNVGLMDSWIDGEEGCMDSRPDQSGQALRGNDMRGFWNGKKLRNNKK